MTNMYYFGIKQPDETLDYAFDISAPINAGNDTVASATAAVMPTGVGELSIINMAISHAQLAGSNVQTWLATLWLAAGIPGRNYVVKLTITTASNPARTFEFLLSLAVAPDLAHWPPPALTSYDFGPQSAWP